MVRRLLRLLFALCAPSVAGCNSPRERADASATVQQAACPPELFMEELHASAFPFQQGRIDVARRHLRRARAAMPSDADAVSARLFAQLSEISSRAETDLAWAQSETERVRLAFADWTCLPDTMHKRFHDALLPLP